MQKVDLAKALIVLELQTISFKLFVVVVTFSRKHEKVNICSSLVKWPI